ncbi:MAG: cadherin-like beta sandwich domain-containing protein [Alphaproteobacteria bacterium]|nr:cadherin-like beta sandwich domain-containing protein [Alphaproteobacteria bacterium]
MPIIRAPRFFARGHHRLGRLGCLALALALLGAGCGGGGGGGGGGGSAGGGPSAPVVDAAADDATLRSVNIRVVPKNVTAYGRPLALSPAFNANRFAYTAAAPAFHYFSVEPVPANSKSSVTVNGKTGVTPGTTFVASAEFVTLETSEETAMIEVRSEDRSQTNTYTFTMRIRNTPASPAPRETCANPSTSGNRSDATLQRITFFTGDGSVNTPQTPVPTFSANRCAYTVMTTDTLSGYEFAAVTANSEAAVQIVGNRAKVAAAEHKFAQATGKGDLPIRAVVTSADGTKTNIYTVTLRINPSSTMTRAPLALSAESGSTGLRVVWTAPDNDGGGAALSYRLRWKKPRRKSLRRKTPPPRARRRARITSLACTAARAAEVNTKCKSPRKPATASAPGPRRRAPPRAHFPWMWTATTRPPPPTDYWSRATPSAPPPAPR